MRSSKQSESFGWVLGIWLFGVFLVLAWQLVPAQHDSWLAFDRLIQTLSALGTVGAAVVSLWIAGKADRKAQAEQVSRARLAAARIVAELSAPIDDLRLALAHHDFREATDETVDSTDLLKAVDTEFTLIKKATGRGEWALDASLTQALVALDTSSAHRLEHGCRKIVSVNRAMLQYSAQWFGEPLISKHSLIEEWFFECEVAMRYVTVAFGACQEAAEVGAPEPRASEIYGLE